MADQNVKADSDDSAKKTIGTSPWDDDLDLPEVPSANKPKIIGSLDADDQPDEKPVPFNIPEEVIEDKVGKKIPAEQVMGSSKPISYGKPMPVQVDQTVLNSPEQKKKSEKSDTIRGATTPQADSNNSTAIASGATGAVSPSFDSRGMQSSNSKVQVPSFSQGNMQTSGQKEVGARSNQSANVASVVSAQKPKTNMPLGQSTTTNNAVASNNSQPNARSSSILNSKSQGLGNQNNGSVINSAAKPEGEKTVEKAPPLPTYSAFKDDSNKAKTQNQPEAKSAPVVPPAYSAFSNDEKEDKTQEKTIATENKTKNARDGLPKSFSAFDNQPTPAPKIQEPNADKIVDEKIELNTPTLDNAPVPKSPEAVDSGLSALITKSDNQPKIPVDAPLRLDASDGADAAKSISEVEKPSEFESADDSIDSAEDIFGQDTVENKSVSIPSKSAMDIVKPSTNISKESINLDLENDDQVKETRPEKNNKSLPSKFRIFGNKNKAVKAKAEIAAEKSKDEVINPPAQNTNPEPLMKPSYERGGGGFGARVISKISIFATIILMLGALVYLTEVGLLSIGLENIYGTVRLEQLWGGLAKQSEPALGMSMTAMQKNQMFKFQGNISVTVNTSVKSSVTSPLVAFMHSPIPLADIMNGAGRAATLAQYDYYPDASTSSATEGDSSAFDPSGYDSTADSSNGSEGSSAVTSGGTGSSADTFVPDQSSSPGYSDSGVTVKQLEFTVNGSSTDSAAQSELTLKPIAGANKMIYLSSGSGNLYVKSDQIKFSDKSQSGKWLEYRFPGFSTGNTIKDFMNLNTSSGLSVSGKRIGNEKIGGARAFKYQIDNMEIGDAFASLGVSKESVNSIRGYVWVGVRDHLIKKVELEITPSVSSSITKMSLNLELSEYGKENSVMLPALNDVIPVADGGTAAKPSDDGGSVTTPPVEENPKESEDLVTPIVSDKTQRTSNDAKREADLQNIKSALIKYKAIKGYYPTAKTFENTSTSSCALVKALVPTYFSVLPSDPNAGIGWWYGYKSDGKTFTLSARFENIYDTEVTKSGDLYLHFVKN